MPVIEIVKDSGKYAGKYITKESFWSDTVISANTDLNKAMASARRKGFEHPFVVYIPKPNTVHVF